MARFGSPARVLVVAGLATAPWLLVLHVWLPSTTRVTGWSTAWLGLDALEGAGLLVTGVLASRRHPLAPRSAALTAGLIVADAWFDLMTSGRGAAFVLAVALAALVELPIALVCLAVAPEPAPRDPRFVGSGVPESGIGVPASRSDASEDVRLRHFNGTAA